MEAIERFQPKGETTYCNCAVQYIAEKMGFTGFDDMLANQMIWRMRNAPDFAVVSPEAAQQIANDGRLVIAGREDQPHGHVCVCAPGTTLYSGKWRDKAPMVFNVGARNGLMGANYAFREMPDYWAWVG